MRRIDRILPWALVALFAAPWLLGLAWDASFEATPSNGALVSEGDDRIRELKVETADRGEDELCWGTGTITGCPASGDNGYAREGSARAFFTVAAPTTLTDGAATALGTGHDGRMRFDSDGVDNVDANLDDNSLFLYNGSAWEKFGLGALGTVDFVTNAPASGNLLRYNGTNWVPITPATIVTRDIANFQASEVFINGACVACTVAGVPDMTGGSDTNNYPEVTVPATPSGPTWDLYITGHISFTWDSSDGTNIGCLIHYDVNDADTFAGTVGNPSSIPSGVAANNSFGNCIFNTRQIGVVSGSRYAVRIEIVPFGATEDWTVEDAAAIAPASLEGSSNVTIEVRPRTAY